MKMCKCGHPESKHSKISKACHALVGGMLVICPCLRFTETKDDDR